MSTMRFASKYDSDMFYEACQNKCKADSEELAKITEERLNELDFICTAEFVDCSNNGGYAPRDICR